VYDTLEKLKACGCVKECNGDEAAYVAIPPSQLVEKIEAEEDERCRRIANAGSRLTEELEDAYLNAPREKELSYAIKGRANIGKQLLNMIEGAKRACVITSYAHSLVLKRPELRTKLEKLEELRIITTTEFEGIAGSKVKKYPVREEFGMIIVDGKTVLIATVEGDSPEYNACVYIMDSKISDGFERAFDFVWRQI
jgi:sugar-specific transcriptional regulator TrmB